jgi:cobalt-zinc-cadmium resistance protein CzcA
LDEVAEISIAPGPNMINRENGKRRIVFTANVRGRDLGSFVAEAQQLLDAKIKVPAGYWIAWGGQFEQLISATKRLQIVVPISLLLIFALLFMTFGTVKDTLLVFSGVPLARPSNNFAHLLFPLYAHAKCLRSRWGDARLIDLPTFMGSIELAGGTMA